MVRWFDGSMVRWFGHRQAIDYSLNRWAAVTRYVDDGKLTADNNWVENPSPRRFIRT